MSKSKREKITIGRREVANLPQFGLMHVAVKVDSGAYTSSIHVSSCQEIDMEGAKSSKFYRTRTTALFYILYLRYFRTTHKNRIFVN
jgi:hypothetical protein